MTVKGGEQEGLPCARTTVLEALRPGQEHRTLEVRRPASVHCCQGLHPLPEAHLPSLTFLAKKRLQRPQQRVRGRPWAFGRRRPSSSAWTQGRPFWAAD